LAPALAAVLAACSLVAPNFQKPTLSVVAVQLKGGNLLQQNFVVTFDIQNPNDRALPVTGLHAELTVGGDRWASGVSDHAFVVPAQGNAHFDMNITANTGLALLKLAQRAGKGSDAIDYQMTGAASIDLPFLHEVPFRQNGSLPLGGF
jgi:LEA14-like dessication related protein